MNSGFFFLSKNRKWLPRNSNRSLNSTKDRWPKVGSNANKVRKIPLVMALYDAHPILPMDRKIPAGSTKNVPMMISTTHNIYPKPNTIMKLPLMETIVSAPRGLISIYGLSSSGNYQTGRITPAIRDQNRPTFLVTQENTRSLCRIWCLLGLSSSSGASL